MKAILTYSTPFNQCDLLRYVHSNRKVTDEFIAQLTHVSNIESSKRGICHGLACTFIAYENNKLGLKFIEQINALLSHMTANTSSDDPIKKQTEKVYAELAFAIIKKHFTDSVNRQIDHHQSVYYNNMRAHLSELKLDSRNKFKSNIDYINHCLSLYKDDNEMFISYGLDFKIERLLVNQLYRKIEASGKIKDPEIPEKNTHIYNKIRRNENLTDDEIKRFLLDAYLYCSMHKEFRTTESNIKSGVTYFNSHPATSYKNTDSPGVAVTKEELENFINSTIKTKSDFYMIYSAQCHSMAITAKYHPKTNNYTFSFFDPNEGVIQVHSAKELCDALTHAPQNKPESTRPEEQKIAMVELIRKSDRNNNRLILPSIKPKDVQILTKNSLVQKQTRIQLQNKAELVFNDYYQGNDELTFNLKLEGTHFTIYSELNDVSKTIETIKSTMHEYPTYNTKNIFIDMQGRIANKILVN